MCQNPLQTFLRSYTKLPDSISTWFELYKEKVYKTRIIPANTKSLFNKRCYCTVSTIKLSPTKFVMYFDERGDFSQGKIQDPLLSLLLKDKDETRIYLKLKNGRISVSDTDCRYSGKLIYTADYEEEAFYYFKYGSAGYSTNKLFHLDDEFIAKYDLKPLLRYHFEAKGGKFM
eukprot:Phypoly_transcript_11879.p1 GENE.Phypoly_transcript_11879~~Phypoly_transcript_11879.p1  ORF type:complete len:173 (+),score=15.46 Phypoly_transcript_11879:140-658(+)